MNTYQMPGDDRVFVLHTDHLACIAELEGENAKLREEVAAFRELVPPAKDIADLLSYYDECEALYLNHNFKPSHVDLERLRKAHIWIRSIAAKVRVSGV